jgi:hypothetical protein
MELITSSSPSAFRSSQLVLTRIHTNQTMPLASGSEKPYLPEEEQYLIELKNNHYSWPCIEELFRRFAKPDRQRTRSALENKWRQLKAQKNSLPSPRRNPSPPSLEEVEQKAIATTSGEQVPVFLKLPCCGHLNSQNGAD